MIAGVCGGILGNMHSYDVLHLSAAWGLFLVVLTVLRRGWGMAASWLRAAAALALTLPTTLYIFYMYRTEAVFQKRANVPTLSPAVWHYALGYGLVFLLALLAGWVVISARRNPPAPNNGGAGEDTRKEGAASRALLFDHSGPFLTGEGARNEREGVLGSPIIGAGGGFLFPSSLPSAGRWPGFW